MSDALDSYRQLCRRNYRLDLIRGRPAREFLDQASGLESELPEDLHLDGVDLRNYSGFPGLPSARALGAALLQAPEDRVLVGPNSSLTLLSWVLSMLWFRGLGGRPPWSRQQNTACLCPVPGYDRHFQLLDTFGMAMPTVPMTGRGADMDAAAEALERHPEIRAVMLVPRHSNPTGDIWSPETLSRLFQLVALQPEDFVILCDNAYAVHDASDAPAPVDIFAMAEQMGVIEKLFLFGSTSKLGYAGSGLSFLAASKANLQSLQQSLQALSLGADPLAQARHALYFGNGEGLRAHLERLAPLWRRRFELAQKALAPLAEVEGVSVSRPTGGYFISLDLPPGTARRTVELSGQAGVRLTAAGSTFPGGLDPCDSNLRLAPTSPPLEQLTGAVEVVCASAMLAIQESKSR